MGTTVRKTATRVAPVKTAPPKAAPAKPAAKAAPAKPAAKPAAKAAPKAASVAAKPVAKTATTLLAHADANHDGVVKIADEGVQSLGTVKATGVSVQADRTALLTAADGLGNNDGTVTAGEMRQFVAEYDANHDGKLAGAELTRLRSDVRDKTPRYRIDADGTKTKADRGYFKHDGSWYYRNEWGSVAAVAADTLPKYHEVVAPPAAFDPSQVGAGKALAATGSPVQSVTQSGDPAQSPVQGPRTMMGATLTGAAAVFNGPGIFVDDPTAFSADMAQKAKAAGFTWIALQGYNSGASGPVRRGTFTKAWVDQMHSIGFKVGAWDVLGGQPVQDAQAAAALVRDNGLDLLIADAEDAHKADAGGDRGRSKVFLDAFRALQPTVALALSSYAAGDGDNVLGRVNQTDGGVMDYKAWNDAGAVFMPQVYPKDYGNVYSLQHTLSQAKQAGWDMSRVKPTLGMYRGETPEYYADLASSDTKGFSIYLGENISDPTFWDRLAKLEAGKPTS